MSIRIRRLGGAVALCAAVVVFGMPVSASAAGKSTALKPDPNGTVRFGQGSTTAFAFDPHTASTVNGWGAYTAAYDRLLQLTTDSRNLAPMLATTWKWDSSNTALTMELRKDAKFQDGTPFTADVAVQNIKRVAAAGSVGNVALATMSSVVAVDASTLKLAFSVPNPGVVYLFAGFGGMMVSPAALANPSVLKTQYAGSGAYKFTGVDAALTYSFDRYEGYWDKKHVYPAHMQIVNIADENTRLNAIKTGSLDASYITGQTYSSANSDKTLQVAEIPSLSPFVVFMNNKIAPFDKLEVRQAVVLAIDRDAANASQSGLCPPLGQAFPPGIEGYVPSLKPTTNASKARQMIASAGANGAAVKIVVSNVEPFITFANVVSAQLQAVGLSPSLVTTTSSLSRVQFRQGGGGILVTTTVVSAPDPTAYVDQYVVGADNPGTPDPQLVGKIQAAEQLPLESKERTAAFQDINKYMAANPIWAPLCQGVNIFVGNSRVIGLKSMPGAALSLAPDNHYLQMAKTK